MAKSKVGGSRAYIRGRIGADVYSIGKDGKGSRQQVVRSLAEQVSNPRTSSQMFGRMVMSTVMQAVSALQPIIDHSFDGLPQGQPSISEFIRRNYALVKADAIAHSASGNQFGLNKYQEKGCHGGKFVVSNGTKSLPAIVSADEASLVFNMTGLSATVGALRSALGLAAGGYITYVGIDGAKNVVLVRVNVKEDVSDNTTISSDNVTTLFDIDSNVATSVSFNNDKVVFVPSDSNEINSFGAIATDKINGAFYHSRCVLTLKGTVGWTSDVALPTYPTGTQQFLNGGDL